MINHHHHHQPGLSHLGHLKLPPELLCQILSYLLPDDLARFGTTCREAQCFMQKDNSPLWKQVFLNVFDPPRQCPLPGYIDPLLWTEFEWFAQLKSRYAARSLVLAQDIQDVQSEQYPKAIQALLEIIDTASIPPDHQSKGQSRDSRLKRSRNIAWLESIFNDNLKAQRFIHDFDPNSYSSRWPPSPAQLEPVLPNRRVTRSMMTHHPPSSPAASRLHILHGLTHRERISKPARGHARHIVYDWSMSSSSQDFGPFTAKTGTTDWRLLEAIYSVVIRNFEATCVSDLDRHYVPTTSDPKHERYSHPHGFRCSLPNLIPRNPSLPHDWARITGNWLGTYSFLDYSDLFHFNAGFRPNPRPSLEDYDEACGDLMRLDLALVDPLSNPYTHYGGGGESEDEDGDLDQDPIFSDPRLTSSLPTYHHAAFPTLFFRGTSQSALSSHPHSPLISVRGRVNLLPPSGREVRWRFIINYAGGDQWQLECVQPGGVGGGGVFGLWTHVDHEAGGPVGPVCYFPEVLCLEGDEGDGVGGGEGEGKEGWGNGAGAGAREEVKEFLGDCSVETERRGRGREREREEEGFEAMCEAVFEQIMERNGNGNGSSGVRERNDAGPSSSSSA